MFATGKWFGDEMEMPVSRPVLIPKFLFAKFDTCSNGGKDCIIQYQAKYEKDIECGGSVANAFGDPIVFSIIFGQSVFQFPEQEGTQEV